jgi:hypothetical protein
MLTFSVLDSVTALLLGTPVLLAVYLIQRTRVNRGLTIVIAVALYAIIAWLFYPVQHQDDALPWYQTTPYKHLIGYLLMLLGMWASVLDKSISERRASTRDTLKQRMGKGATGSHVALRFDRWDFVQPFLYSWFTYNALISHLNSGLLDPATCILSIQTGFCWETIVNRGLERVRKAEQFPAKGG